MAKFRVDLLLYELIPRKAARFNADVNGMSGHPLVYRLAVELEYVMDFIGRHFIAREIWLALLKEQNLFGQPLLDFVLEKRSIYSRL